MNKSWHVSLLTLLTLLSLMTLLNFSSHRRRHHHHLLDRHPCLCHRRHYCPAGLAVLLPLRVSGHRGHLLLPVHLLRGLDVHRPAPHRTEQERMLALLRPQRLRQRRRELPGQEEPQHCCFCLVRKTTWIFGGTESRKSRSLLVYGRQDQTDVHSTRLIWAQT